eukprot:13479929-Alexandrium_andersonii.AAC.1
MVPLGDSDLFPRTRRTVTQLGAAGPAIAKTWAGICAAPGLEPVNISTTQRSASDLAVGPWGQDPACEAPRTGPRTSQQWAVCVWNRVADW